MASLEELKDKYGSVLELIKEKWVRLDHVHVQDDKLFIGAVAPSDDIKNDIWNQIKAVDSGFSDLTAEISVDSSMPKPPKTYTVVGGDSMWKIAQEHLGNGAHFPKIIAANPGKLKDEHSVIHPGDVLTIPD